MMRIKKIILSDRQNVDDVEDNEITERRRLPDFYSHLLKICDKNEFSSKIRWVMLYAWVAHTEE
jgi:hypothetical protein